MSFELYLRSFNKPKNIVTRILNIYNLLVRYWNQEFPTLTIFTDDYILYKISQRLQYLLKNNDDYTFNIEVPTDDELKSAIFNKVIEIMRDREGWTDPFLIILFD
jgi:hypothetical protein